MAEHDFQFLSSYPLSLSPKGGRAFKNCLAGNFSEGARLPRWPLLILSPSPLGEGREGGKYEK